MKPGQKYGRLTVKNLHHIGKHNRSYFTFQCDCGQEKVILGSLVKSGNTKSCGCLSRETKQAKRLPNNHGEITAIILGYKRHAKRRGFDFHLKRADVEVIVREDCYYCGSKPRNKKTTKNSIKPFPYNGIDRINSKIGYTVDNVVPCCDFCNKAKGNKSIKEFVDWINRVHEKAMAEQWG